MVLHHRPLGKIGGFSRFPALACWWFGSWGWWYLSYVELLILFELWAGERLSLEKAHPRYLRPGRPISVSAVPFGLGIDIWRSCRFIGATMRSLCLLPGGLGRFVPCSIGANHCWVRHIGWEKCGHGLTSRPRESASEPFLNELLSLFSYPPGSARALLAGTLRPRYCAARFASGTPTWRLPVLGYVAGQISDTSWEAQEVVVEGVARKVHWVSGSGPDRRRIQSRSRVWKRLSHVGHFSDFIPDRKRRRDDQDDGRHAPARCRTGVG